MASTLLVLAGLALLIYAAELVVCGSSQLALAVGVRPLVLGITVVAIGTSAPELAVGITAALGGSGGLAVGNIAGTNMVNLLLILGLSALLRPLPLQQQTIKLDLPMVLAASLLMAALAWDGALSRNDGITMLIFAALYTVALIRVSRHASRAIQQEYREDFGADTATRNRSPAHNRSLNMAIFAVGVGLLVLGAHWLVEGAVDIARRLGFSETIIGLSIAAIGNLMGSSVYNILVILGITCLIPAQDIVVERSLLTFDIPLMVGVAILCVPVFVTDRNVSRLEGGFFVLLYTCYLSWLLFMRA